MERSARAVEEAAYLRAHRDDVFFLVLRGLRGALIERVGYHRLHLVNGHDLAV